MGKNIIDKYCKGCLSFFSGNFKSFFGKFQSEFCFSGKIFHIFLDYSIQDSIYTTFQIILGNNFIPLLIFFDSRSILIPLVFLAFSISVIFVMLNLLVSVLINYFDVSRADRNLENEDPETFEYLKSVILSIVQIVCRKRTILDFEKATKLNHSIDRLNTRIDGFLSRIEKVN